MPTSQPPTTEQGTREWILVHSVGIEGGGAHRWEYIGDDWPRLVYIGSRSSLEVTRDLHDLLDSDRVFTVSAMPEVVKALKSVHTKLSYLQLELADELDTSSMNDICTSLEAIDAALALVHPAPAEGGKP